VQSSTNFNSAADNHRPSLSSDTAPETARLKKSSKDESYNLGFDDQGDKYQYNGVRTTDDGNYVLIFDPARKAFVLHRVDSTFHMNITRTPTDSNAESLRKKFPQLEVKSPSTKLPKGKAGGKPGPGKAASAKVKGGRNEETPKAKSNSQSEKNKPVGLTLPDLNAPTKKSEPSASQSEQEKKPKRPALSPVESEEDDDDDDGGLTVEYPEGNPAAFRSSSQYMPTIPVVTRRFSEFADERESEEDDFDTGMTGGYDVEEGYEEEEYEEEEEEEPSRQPLSPARPKVEMPPAEEPVRYTFDDGDEDEDAAGDDALDIGELEAELEREFDKAQNGGHESDSSVSEEE
jgi:hypothetical protein